MRSVTDDPLIFITSTNQQRMHLFGVYTLGSTKVRVPSLTTDKIFDFTNH